MASSLVLTRYLGSGGLDMGIASTRPPRRITHFSPCPHARGPPMGTGISNSSSLQSASGANGTNRRPPLCPTGFKPEIPARLPPLDHRACTKPYRSTPRLRSPQLIGAPGGLDETPSNIRQLRILCPSRRMLVTVAVDSCRNCNKKETENEDLPPDCFKLKNEKTPLPAKHNAFPSPPDEPCPTPSEPCGTGLSQDDD